MIPQNPANMKKEFIPHTNLKQPWNFIALQNGEILGIMWVATKAFVLLDDNNTPKINMFGEKEHYIEGQLYIKSFTKEEYKKVTFDSQIGV